MLEKLFSILFFSAVATHQYIAPQPVEAYTASVPIPDFPEPIENKIRDYAEQYEIPYQTLYNMALSESGVDPTKEGDHGCSWGLVQINICAHPNITKAEALDADFALSYASSALKKGKEDAWTVCACPKWIKVKIPNAPLQDASDFKPNSTPHVGSVAIFDYNGVAHVAYVEEIHETYFKISETNYHPCLLGNRDIQYTDPHLVGFWSIN